MSTLGHRLGQVLAESGITTGFGVVGSGNFHLTNGFRDAGGEFIAARHEGGAATMADAHARTSETVGLVTVHQGCGYTNAITGIAEAAKSRTPLVVIVPQAMATTSNFFIDSAAIAEAVGAVPWIITDDDQVPPTVSLATAVTSARNLRRTIVVTIPLDVLERPVTAADEPAGLPDPPARPVPVDAAAVTELAAMVAAAERPVVIAGRGARGARAELIELGRVTGALLATSAVAAGLFAGDDWDIGISGGFASPATAELIRGADLIVGFGCALNMWTMRHGALISSGTKVVQVDDTAEALGAHRQIHLGVHGDAGEVAAAVTELASPRTGYRTPAAAALVARRDWSSEPYEDRGTDAAIDPRTLTLALNELLPANRIVAVDSGNFMGYPAMFFDHADVTSLCFTQAFQSIGLGLATAIGAAVAQPHRLVVAALGDGGAAMGLAELETVVRLGLRMVVVVYNDAAYSAEVHHFTGADHATVTFGDVDFAATARGLGFAALTARTAADLAQVTEWVRAGRGPLLIDAKVAATGPAWWLSEAFGH